MLPGQRVKGKLNDMQLRAMLGFAGLTPPVRKEYLQDVIARPDLGGFNQDPAISGFGIHINSTMQQIKARILPAPALAYRQPACLNPGTKVQYAWCADAPFCQLTWVRMNTVQPAAAVCCKMHMCYATGIGCYSTSVC